MANNSKSDGGNKRMPLSMKNYIMMLVGAAIIVIGFILMSGGGDHTPTHFDESIYSTRRITVAPIVVIVGFVFEIFAIMWRFPEGDNNK